MINIEATIRWMGYNPEDLSYGSNKKIWAICDNCGKGRWLRKQDYRDLCLNCKMKSTEQRKKLSGKNNGMFGKHHTEESKNKISNNLKILFIGEGNPFFGKTHSTELKEKMSKNWSGKNNPWYGKDKFGENNPNYNPDITDEERQSGRFYPEYKEWRKNVYERDKYTCQVCNQIGYDLNAHHLENYADNPELRITLENGITLCEDCHKDFHHKYGRGNNTLAQFIEFMGESE